MPTLRFVVEGAPISVNKLYATFRGRRILSRSGKSYKSAVGWLASQVMRTTGFDLVQKNDVWVQIDFYFATKRGDIDNGVKAILDGMKGVVYTDDGQVQKLVVYKFKDAENPRTEIQVAH